MAAKLTKAQIKNLKEDCIVESTLEIWMEIEGTKREERLVSAKRATGETTTKWESGVGIYHGEWIPLEHTKTKQIYQALLKKRIPVKKYTPSISHKNIQSIQKYLTPEERHYWWKLTHKIVSIKKTENKYKRDKNNNLVAAACPT